MRGLSERSTRVDYALTPLGRSLDQIVDQFRQWSEQHVQEVLRFPSQFEMGDHTDGRPWLERQIVVQSRPALLPLPFGTGALYPVCDGIEQLFDTPDLVGEVGMLATVARNAVAMNAIVASVKRQKQDVAPTYQPGEGE